MYYSNGEQYSMTSELLEVDVRASGNKIVTAEELLKGCFFMKAFKFLFFLFLAF